MKKITVPILAFLAALLCAGCGKAAHAAVYYLNFKPEQNDAWQRLAAVYTEQTGVPVTVVTAAAGNYEPTLMSEMAKSDAPTLFQVNGPIGLANWREYCYDLSGSAVYGELNSDSYALKDGDKALGIAYVVESYGLIVDLPLLARAGYSTDDIRGFDDLRRIAEEITARQDELGFAAFTSAGMDSSSDWRFKTHLANLPITFEYRADGVSMAKTLSGTYLDRYRAIWDLYIHNSTCAPDQLAGKTGDDALHEFLAREAVFYQNGSWCYRDLIDGGFTDEELAMIPLYIGADGEETQGLCTGTENYWCVNAKADEDRIQATLDFLYWCVTSPEGTAALADDMGFVSPFRAAKEPQNLFARQDRDMTLAGKQPVPWNFTTMPSEEWKNGVGSALTAYAAGTADWSAVVTAFVDGWAAEYAAHNG